MPTRPPVHRPQGWRPPAQVRHEYEMARGSSASRGYGADWKRFRAGYLQQHPLCRDCEAAGRLTPATELHHLAKPRDNPELRLAASNVLGLCVSCHSRRTGRGE
jgi:5-methylcytosine-specific restriction protein A